MRSERLTTHGQKTEEEHGKHDPVKQFTRAMSNITRILSPTKITKPSANGTCGGLCIAISGEKGDATNKTVEVSACFQRK